MKSFKVIALTKLGREGIERNYLERERMRALDKLLLKKMFAILVPLDFSSIEFSGKNRASDFVDSASMIKSLSDSMVSDGCEEGRDFRVEVRTL